MLQRPLKSLCGVCMIALFGKKIGMTQLFIDGVYQSVTVVAVPPVTVIGQRQLASGQRQTTVGAMFSKQISVPQRKELQKIGISEALSHRTTFFDTNERKPADRLSLADISPGQRLTVVATTKGKGFAGTIKRHGFTRGPESHGSDNVRRPGAIGSQRPQRVIKGKRMAGHMGVDQRTLAHVRVVDVMENEQLLLLAGSIPGPKKSLLTLRVEESKT